MKYLAPTVSQILGLLWRAGTLGLLCIALSDGLNAGDSIRLQLLSASDPNLPLAETGGGVSGGGRWSSDGRWVFFLSDAPGLVPGQPTGRALQLFARSLPDGATFLVSGSADGRQVGSAPVRDYDISADGSKVVWSTKSTNLIPGAIPGVADIYLRDLAVDTLVRISTDGQGQAGSDDSGNARLSKDGRWLLFESRADNLTASNPQHIRNVFLRDLSQGTVGTNLLISATTDGSPTTGDCTALQVSAHGEMAVFRSKSTNLVQSKTGTVTDLYLYRPATGELTNLAVPVALTNSTQYPFLSGAVVLSPDGRYLAFRLRNSLGPLTPADGLWWFDLESSTNVHISTGLSLANPWVIGDQYSGYNGPAMTSDGRTIAFTAISDRTATNQVMIWNADTGLHHLDDLLITVPPGFYEPTSSSDPVLSPDGRHLIYQSFAPVPAAGVTNGGGYRVYLRDLITGATTTLDPTGTPRFDAAIPEFSSDGSSILIQSQDPVSGHRDLNQQMDLMTVGFDWSPTTLVSAAPPQNGPSTAWGISSLNRNNLSNDGQSATFSSTAVDLSTNATDGFPNVFAFAQSLGHAQLASGSTLPADAKYYASSPRISGNGRYIAFLSENPILAPGVQGQGATIYVRDLITQTTFVAGSVGGLFGDNPILSQTGAPAISNDGRYVTFRSSVAGKGSQIFLRDLQSSTTTWLTDRSLGFSSTLPSSLEPGPEISSDGSAVGFLGDNSASSLFLYSAISGELSSARIANGLSLLSLNLSASGQRAAFLVAPFHGKTKGVLWHDNLTGTTNWVATQARGSDRFSDVHISSNGQRIVFVSNFVPPGSTNTNTFNQVFVFEIPTITLTQVSMPIGGGTSDGPSRSPAISGDGRWVVFESDASNLVPYVQGSPGQIWIRDLDTGLMALVSHRLGDGRPGDLPSALPQISTDGSTVLFVSFADDLVPFDNNGTSDVFRAMIPDPSTFDGNGNGLPDAWELKYFGNLNQTANGDFDGDGISNLDEYQSGTDPRDPQSYLHTTGASLDLQNQLQITFPSNAGIIYQLMETKTLKSANFQPAGISVVGTGAPLTLSIPASDAQGFVRLSAHR